MGVDHHGVVVVAVFRICCCCTDLAEESGVLFRPCLCKGSCALVHVGCLDEWRNMSQNPNSAMKCDQCKYEYKFDTAENRRKLMLAKLFGSRFFLEITTFLVLIAIILVVGFVIECV